MPAQKLTPARLIQIIVMLTILIGAFIWRTYEYQDDETAYSSCVIKNQRCSVKISSERLDIQEVAPGQLRISKPNSNWQIMVEPGITVDNRENGWHITTDKNLIDVQLGLPNNVNHQIRISL